MTEKDMFRLLEIHDAMDALEKVQEALTGDQSGTGYGEGILGRLSYVTDIIAENSPVYKRGKTYDTLWDLLEDRSIDNRRKARLLLQDR